MGNSTSSLSTTSEATSGQILQYNGTIWAPATLGTGSSKWATTTGNDITPNGDGGIFVRGSSSTVNNLKTDNTTSTNSTSTNNYTSGQTRLASLAGLLFGTSGVVSAISASTNGFIFALADGIPTWVASSTLSTISGLLNLVTQVTGILGVGNGGTGATTLPAGGLLVGSGTGAVTGTSSPTVGYITATSTSATSTFAGPIKIQSGTTVEPSEQGQIGIDTTSDQLKIFGTTKRVFDSYRYPAITVTTSTAWTGTTTVAIGPAGVNETWVWAKCFTDAGTLQVSFNDATNRMNFINASTTVGTTTLSTNNSFFSSEKRFLDVGTPASSPKSLSCTVAIGIDSN